MSEAALRQRLFKPKTKRAKRALKDRAPKIIEDPKRQLLLRGNKISPITKQLLKDLVKFFLFLIVCISKIIINGCISFYVSA